MAISLSTEVSGAGSYPAIRFNQRERKILESVKTYVDTLDSATDAAAAALVLDRPNSKGTELAALADDYAITTSDGLEVIVVNDAIKVTLPAAASSVGRRLVFIQKAAAVLTIGQNADDANIAGADADLTTLDAAGDIIELVCDGAQWITLASVIA